MAANNIFEQLEFEPASIPTALSDLLGFSTTCGCGRTHETHLRRIVMERGALDSVVDLSEELGKGGKRLVVTDAVIADIAGNRVKTLLAKAGHKPSLLLLPDGPDGRPHADDANLERVIDAMNGSSLAVAVGSGTVNDLTKLASYRLGIPYIAVATAPSMNGYTSAIAAVMQRGVKRTVACHQPAAVLADLDILKDAPMALIAAGLGDLESKPTATADFRLGGMLRGEYYCSAPEQVVLDAEKRAADAARGLKARDPDAIAALTEALLLSGISMKLAGSSSPASGGEHLISHFLDMTAAADNRFEGWHGAQVGVATLLTATLYEMLATLSPDAVDVEHIVRTRPSLDSRLPEIRRIHGRFADEVIAEYRAKRLSDDALMAEVELIKENWAALWSRLAEVTRPAATIRKILKAAGAPTSAADLGVTPTQMEVAFYNARYIRGRFTVLDFTADLGLFDKLAPRVLKKSGCIG